MPNEEHSHRDKYITRVITRTLMGGEGNQGVNDFLQKICEQDGVLFEEIKISDVMREQEV